MVALHFFVGFGIGMLTASALDAFALSWTDSEHMFIRAAF
jgi:hypothetical protein